MQKILCKIIVAFDTNIISVIKINKHFYRKRKKIQSANFNQNSLALDDIKQVSKEDNRFLLFNDIQ